MTDKKCPFDPVRKRMDDAYTQLHQLHEAYFDPEAFRLHLNNVIQALRNVTWILQSNKHLVPDFNAWYAPWQAAMGKDRILRWAKDARTQVVKQGDLETRSIARVAIVDSYLERESDDIAVPPHSSAEDIATLIASTLRIDEEHKKHAIVRVERRWVDEKLSDTEIFDALRHVFECLDVVVQAAHDQAAGLDAPVLLPQVKAATTNLRTAFLKLSDLEFLTPASEDREVDFEGLEERLKEHYGDDILNLDPSLSLTENAYRAFHTARITFERDGYHRNFALLIGQSNGMVVEISARDKAEKFLIWRNIAETVKANRIEGIIVIGEVWRAFLLPGSQITDAADAANRIEGLSLQAASIDGEYVDLFAQIHRRDDDSAYLGETIKRTGQPNYLEPIFEVWSRARDKGWSAVQ